MMNDREGTYQAMWFLKKDLKNEKMQLLESMRDMSLSYDGNSDFYDAWKEEFTERLEEINRILLRVDTGYWRAPEDDHEV